jgi:hypothetical protein
VAAFADCHGALSEWPEAGDLFLLASPERTRFVAIGIVALVNAPTLLRSGVVAYPCTTIEGERRGDLAEGSAITIGGFWPYDLRVRVRIISRHLSLAFGDRFIRWTALDRLTGREVAS